MLKTVGDHLVIAGTGKRGTLYGCTTLLEKLGVRFLTPGITHVPKLSNPALPKLDETQAPSFEYREPYFKEALDKDWAARLKINGHHAGLDDSTGGHLTYGVFVHSFDMLVPQDLFAAHPEYFPLIKGERKNGYVQRCLTNPDVLKLSIEKVRGWMRENPTHTIFSASQNDTHNACQCDACVAVEQKFGGKHSGVYLWFVNQIAEAVEKEFPDKLIDTLAYQFTEAPPQNIRPRKNVRIRLCPIACCEAHPYEQCSHKANRAFVVRLRNWAGLTDNLYIWHYNINFHHYLAPFPDFKQFPDSLRLYHKSGVKGVFFQGDYSSIGGAQAELRSYVMAKLLWDVTADADALVNEWMTGVYGDAAARPLKRWFDLLHEKAAAPDVHLYVHGDSPFQYYTPELLAQARGLFDEAEKLAAGNQVALRQIAKERLCVRYVELEMNPRKGPEFEQFLADIKQAGITHMKEPADVAQWEAQYRAKAK